MGKKRGKLVKNYGEIRIDNHTQFVIFCCFCDQKLSKMKEFVQHYYDVHTDCEYKPEPDQQQITATKQHQIDNNMSSIYYDCENSIKIESDDFNTRTELQNLEIITLPRTDFILSSENLSNDFNNSDEHEEVLDNDNCEWIDIEQTTIKNDNYKIEDEKSGNEEFIINPSTDNFVGIVQNKNDNIQNNDLEEDSNDETLKSEIELLDKDNYCIKCNRLFVKSYNFKKHLESHNIEFKCDKCNSKFSTRSKLKQHLECHIEIRSFKCKICSKAFKSKKIFNSHNRIHIGNKQFSCDWCGDTRKFFTKREKLIHEGTMHTKDYQYQCELCGRGFALHSLLSRHKRHFHVTESKFICKFCNKAFKTRSGVYKHEKIHSSERRFECETCKKRFISNSKLKSHSQTHTGFKPYKCKLCEKCFSARISLRHHLKTIHDELFDNNYILLS